MRSTMIPNRVIEKHDQHAMAYERRGFVNYIMGNMSDALYDFNKCISYDPSIPDAYYWRARVHMRNKDWDNALEDLDWTTKKAIFSSSTMKYVDACPSV